MDKLIITDIKLPTLIGIHPWEQVCPQVLHLDLVFQTDAKKIAEQDSIQYAIDYTQVVRQITHFAKEYHFQLIETFADKLATYLLENFPTQWVQICLHKPGALSEAKDVAIIIERTNPSC